MGCGDSLGASEVGSATATIFGFGWRGAKRELDKLTEHIADFAGPPKLWSGKDSSKVRLAEALEEMVRIQGMMKRCLQGSYYRLGR